MPVPKIAILMATFNGFNYIAAQVESQLKQMYVDVTIFVSDDLSIDGTFEFLQELAVSYPKIKLLSRSQKYGSAGKNFYRLICDVDISVFDYVAFADQDDIWSLDKLSKQIKLIKTQSAEAVSSNVIAFWPDAHQKLIVKSQSQKDFDFLFESAGPGCSFLMTPWLVNHLKQQLLTNPETADVELHDWLTYAICRAHRKRWLIDPIPSIKYRQHQSNLVGANSGFRAGLGRLKKIKSGWYRQQVELISKVVTSINPDDQLLFFQKIIQKRTILNQFRLLPYAFQGRRKLSDRIVLILCILLFIF